MINRMNYTCWKTKMRYFLHSMDFLSFTWSFYEYNNSIILYLSVIHLKFLLVEIMFERLHLPFLCFKLTFVDVVGGSICNILEECIFILCSIPFSPRLVISCTKVPFSLVLFCHMNFHCSVIFCFLVQLL